MKQKVTIQQIADLTGVSKFAVSRALSGKSGVSPATRERIVQAAGQLGYYHGAASEYPAAPAAAAASPKEPGGGDNKGAIVAMFPNIRYQNHDSVYWGPIFDGISARLNQRRVDILSLTEPSSDHVFSLLNPEAIQGIITLGSVSSKILMDIKRLSIPLVMVDHVDLALQADTIFTDNITCMRQMILKLVSRGYRKYQFVGNIRDAHSFYERWLGFSSVLNDYDIPHEQNRQLLTLDLESIYMDFPAAIAGWELPEVFVCVNDTTAMYVMETLAKSGIEVPRQVNVTGFDNSNPELPILGTVDIDEEAMGMRAVDKLLWRIANPAAHYEKTLIQAKVIVREMPGVSRDSQPPKPAPTVEVP